MTVDFDILLEIFHQPRFEPGQKEVRQNKLMSGVKGIIRRKSAPVFGCKQVVRQMQAEVSLHDTQNAAIRTAEQTGSSIFHALWSYVSGYVWERS
ncbi:uncharacterized protein N7479_005773 [Penicillium vulpinum]|uniref:uncharacterized protein n=1 Tax=Penicillium vulpinum TaxID=29845 RepID=UPI0025499D26|nr:uncharacterized protein N7479_005773 [Penicillium vulpinum]KAJ5958623.1 hypothetical protein N7479_005773 [Penicillium vulpinum]